MKIDYTKEEARAIERSYFDMVHLMENPVKGRPCSKREIKIATDVMFHTLSVCGVKFIATGYDGGAFHVFAPDGNEFAECKKDNGGGE